MITKESEIKKYCCFYASEYHLEMILLPFIKKNIEKNFFIITQNKMSESIKVLLEKTNFTNYEKNKILNLDWNNNKLEKELMNVIDEANIIINGDSIFIENNHKKIFNKKIKKINLIDCYYIDEVKENVKEIQKKYLDILNIKNGYNLRIVDLKGK